MMGSEYADAEIDKLLETFSMSGQFKNTIVNGELIENDIRLSEAIREAIEEIKQLQKLGTSKVGDMDKRKYLAKYTDVAELLGVSMTVEHLLPLLSDLVLFSLILINIRACSSNKTTVTLTDPS